MISLISRAISSRTVTQGSKNFALTYSQIDKTGKKFGIWKDKFEFHSRRLLTEQGCALCHELARYSMPVRANTQFTSEQARATLEKENAELAKIAFKPVTLKGPVFWLLAGHHDIADYVMKETGFAFKNETLKRWYNNGQYEILKSALIDWGGYKKPTKSEIPSSSSIIEEADYSKFVRWKSRYKKDGASKPFWVKREASIKKIQNEKSIYNYASICINGWLKASAKLGDKLPQGVRKITWNYGKGLGSGDMKIIKISDTHFKLTYSNKYGNLNGIFNGAVQQAIYRRRMAIASDEIKKLMKTMLKYWNTIRV
jgi:hypothetical protein